MSRIQGWGIEVSAGTIPLEVVRDRSAADIVGLLLVGHGSGLSPASSEPVRRLAAAFEAEKGVRFAEVATAFWKEDPPLRGALERMRSASVVVLPVFMADGYYTRRVVPRELGLDRPERRVVYADPLGAWPAIDAVVERCADEAAGRAPGLIPTKRRGAALILVGHGTPRSTTSADTTYAAAARIAARGGWGRVACGFLDEDPRITDVVAEAGEPDIVLVPFFLAEGWHTRRTIPDALGLTGRRTLRDGRTLRYARAVGGHDAIGPVVREGIGRFLPSSCTPARADR